RNSLHLARSRSALSLPDVSTNRRKEQGRPRRKPTRFRLLSGGNCSASERNPVWSSRGGLRSKTILGRDPRGQRIGLERFAARPSSAPHREQTLRSERNP